MKIVIPGNPIAKARHRDGIKRGKRIKYDPQQIEKQKVIKYLKWYIQSYFETGDKEKLKEGRELATAKGFELHVIFYLPIAENDSNASRNAKLWGLTPHTQKPDGSNLLKFYEDAANDVLYKDDCQLVVTSAKKKWSEYPRTELNIMPIKSSTPEEVQILSFFSPEDFKNLAIAIKQLPEINEFVEWEDLFTEDQNRKAAAKILSKIADKYASALAKITKKCPGYWKKDVA
jgi:Holliday junction resolvase RusA-like endonuclease